MKGTLIYSGQRLVLIAFTALAVSSIVFIGIHLQPGSALISDRPSSPQALAQLLHRFNLDLPWPQQYWLWLTHAIRGDFGVSLATARGERLTPVLVREAGVSATLGAFALLFTIGVGITLGTLAAIRQNTWVDYVASTAAVVTYSMPSFVWAFLLLILTISGLYNWTHGAIYENIGWGKPEQIPVPALALGLPYAAQVARLTRASMLEVIRQDYVRTAWAKGLAGRVVVIRHALRNALIPVVTILGPLGTAIITGSVVIEYLFGIPGLGKEFVESILARDYNVVIAVFTSYALLVGLVNLLVDLSYPILDPRIRY